jgi:ankyrin repeat protein
MSSSVGGSNSSGDSSGAAKHPKLVTAVLYSNAIDLFRKYHERGIDIFSCEGAGQRSEKSIFGAAALGRVGVIRLLHELGGNLNDADYTPICWATGNGHIDAIRTLCGLGADNNTANKNDITPVFAAARKGLVEAIRALCELGADVNASDKGGCTPVYFAAQDGNVEAICALCDLGSDIHTPTNKGATPL